VTGAEAAFARTRCPDWPDRTSEPAGSDDRAGLYPDDRDMEKILLLDQDYYWRNWVKACIAFEKIDADVVEVADDDQLINELEKPPISIVMVDPLSSDMGAIPALQAIRDRAPLAKVLMFTAGSPQAHKFCHEACPLGSAYLFSKEDVVRELGPLIRDILRI